MFCPLDGTGCIRFRHRGDAPPRWKEAKPVAFRQPAGHAMEQSRYSRRTAMLSTGSVDGCRLIFSEAEGPPIRGTGALGKPGERKESAAGKSGGFLLFRGRGQGGTQCPLSGVPGVKLPARVKGGRPLSGCRGAERPVDVRLAPTGAERRPKRPAPGRGRKAPPNRVAVYGSPYWVLPAENVSQKPPGSRGRSI